MKKSALLLILLAVYATPADGMEETNRQAAATVEAGSTAVAGQQKTLKRIIIKRNISLIDLQNKLKKACRKQGITTSKPSLIELVRQITQKGSACVLRSKSDPYPTLDPDSGILFIYEREEESEGGSDSDGDSMEDMQPIDSESDEDGLTPSLWRMIGEEEEEEGTDSDQDSEDDEDNT